MKTTVGSSELEQAESSYNTTLIEHLGEQLIDALQEYARKHQHPEEEYGAFMDKNGNATPDSNAACDVAANLAHKMLQAVGRNGLGGCLLCRS